MTLDNSPQVIMLPQQQRRRRSRPLSQVLMGCINKENSSGASTCSSKGDIVDHEWQFVKQYPPEYNFDPDQPEDVAVTQTSSTSFATAGFNMMKQRSKSLMNMFVGRKQLGSKQSERLKKVDVYDKYNRTPRITRLSTAQTVNISKLYSNSSLPSIEPHNSFIPSTSSSSSASFEKSCNENRSQIVKPVHNTSNCSSKSSSSSKLDIPFMDESPRMRKRNCNASPKQVPVKNDPERCLTYRHEPPLLTSTYKKGSVNDPHQFVHLSSINDNLNQQSRPRSKSCTRVSVPSGHQVLVGGNQSKLVYPKVETYVHPSSYYGIHSEKYANSVNNATEREFFSHHNARTRSYVSVTKKECVSSATPKYVDNSGSYAAPIPQIILPSKQRNTKSKPVPPVRRDSLSTKHGEQLLTRRNARKNVKPRPKSCGDILIAQNQMALNPGDFKETVNRIPTTNATCSKSIEVSQQRHNSNLITNLMWPMSCRDRISPPSSYVSPISKNDLTTYRLRLPSSSVEYIANTDDLGFIQISPTTKRDTNHIHYTRSSLVLHSPQDSRIARTINVKQDAKNTSEIKELDLMCKSSSHVSLSYLNDDNIKSVCYSYDFSAAL